LLPLVDGIPTRRGGPGRPVRKPQLVPGDRGYDSQPRRDQLVARGIRSHLAKGRRPRRPAGVAPMMVERRIASRIASAWQCATSGARVFTTRFTSACSLVCSYYLKPVISFRRIL
jgi:hypothetical protein